MDVYFNPVIRKTIIFGIRFLWSQSPNVFSEHVSLPNKLHQQNMLDIDFTKLLPNLSLRLKPTPEPWTRTLKNLDPNP